MKEPKVRFIEKSDLNDLIKLCELHAVFEQSEYNSKNKNWKNICFLTNQLYSAWLWNI